MCWRAREIAAASPYQCSAMKAQKPGAEVTVTSALQLPSPSWAICLGAAANHQAGGPDGVLCCCRALREQAEQAPVGL